MAMLVGAGPLAAQHEDVPTLVQRAVRERARRDTTLGAWRATAEGLVRFASVVRHGGIPVERVIRADELLVEVYGDAPSRSKQVIRAWRDTTFLPNALIYHRDHLGIVANDFGDVLRLGEGDEVADVPHPLTPRGLAHYRFTVEDSLTLRTPHGVVRVVQVGVAPRDPGAAGAVGRLALDGDRAAVVRFAFTFTPAAYRDPTVRDITVTLENALVDDAEWLPWRQTIAIRRATPWLDLPLETVLRADWRIDGYTLGVVHPPGRFTGRLVDGLRVPGGPHAWDGPLAARLAGAPLTSAELEQLRDEATDGLGVRLRSGLPLRRIALDGVSSALRVNRVQGVAVGAGLRLGERGRGAVLDLGVGTADGGVTGGLRLERGPWSLGVERRVEDAIAVPPASGVVRSLSALVAGRDFGDWVRVDRAALAWSRASAALTLAREGRRDAVTRFTALDGSRLPSRPLGGPAAWRLGARLGEERRVVSADVVRDSTAWLQLTAALVQGAGPLHIEARGGIVTAGAPAWAARAVGGRGTLVGTPHRELVGRRSGVLLVGRPVAMKLPAPPLSMLRGTALPAVVMPFASVGAAGGTVTGWDDRRQGSRLVAGVRLDLWGIVRVELAAGGGFGLTVDAHPDWWPVL